MRGLLKAACIRDSLYMKKMTKYIIGVLALVIPSISFGWVVVVPPGGAVYANNTTLGMLKWLENDPASGLRRVYPAGESGSSGLEIDINYPLMSTEYGILGTPPQNVQISKFFLTTTDSNAGRWICFDIYRKLYQLGVNVTSGSDLDSTASGNFALHISSASPNIVQTMPSVTTAYPSTPSGGPYSNLRFVLVNCNNRCTGSGTPYSCCTGAGAGNCTQPSNVRFLGAIFNHY
ncbi:MAG: hypothetical protein QXS54_00355 [Candidatus Methanomethylicaceae archaeon]